MPCHDNLIFIFSDICKRHPLDRLIHWPQRDVHKLNAGWKKKRRKKKDSKEVRIKFWIWNSKTKLPKKFRSFRKPKRKSHAGHCSSTSWVLKDLYYNAIRVCLVRSLVSKLARTVMVSFWSYKREKYSIVDEIVISSSL